LNNVNGFVLLLGRRAAPSPSRA